MAGLLLASIPVPSVEHVRELHQSSMLIGHDVSSIANTHIMWCLQREGQQSTVLSCKLMVVWKVHGHSVVPMCNIMRGFLRDRGFWGMQVYNTCMVPFSGTCPGKAARVKDFQLSSAVFKSPASKFFRG